jgi:hypothetical protein
MTSDGAFIAAGRSGTTSGPSWLLMKYCPEEAPGGELSVLQPGPPDWGFRLHKTSGDFLDTIAFTGTNPGAYGDVTGLAATLSWSPMPGGDGNNGDSIFFVAASGFVREWADTFWIRGMAEDRCLLAYVAGCPKDTVATESGAHPEIVADGPNRSGFALVHDVAQVRRLAFSSFTPGTTGHVTGDAAATWHPLPNGDGNNGDSVIFVSSAPLISGSVDTFWLLRPGGRGSVRWSVGCHADTLSVFSAHVDSAAFSGIYLSSGVELSATTWNERGVRWIKIFGGHYSSWGLLTSIPAANDTGVHHYDFNAGGRNMGYQFLLSAEDSFGVQRQYVDQILTLGQNVPVDPQHATFMPWRYLSAFPNPFNPSTTISFSLPREARARIAVFDILGREVTVLADNVFTAGEHRLMFDGSSLPSGLYFARLESGSMQATHKLLLLK